MRKNTDITKDYFTGKCTEEVEKAVDSWYTSLGNGRKTSALSPGEVAALEQKLWKLIKSRIDKPDDEL